MGNLALYNGVKYDDVKIDGANVHFVGHVWVVLLLHFSAMFRIVKRFYFCQSGLGNMVSYGFSLSFFN